MAQTREASALKRADKRTLPGQFFISVDIHNAHPQGWKNPLAFQAHHMLSEIDNELKDLTMQDLAIALTINHIGLCVDDIEAGVTWYSKVFGFTMLDGPFDICDDGSDDIEVARVMLGTDLNHLRVAHMASGDGVGLEIFQFVDPAIPNTEAAGEWRRRFFHICITHPDVAALRGRIVQEGGVARTKVMSLRNNSPVKLCYCSDPFGNVIELMSSRYEQIFSNRN